MFAYIMSTVPKFTLIYVIPKLFVTYLVVGSVRHGLFSSVVNGVMFFHD